MDLLVWSMQSQMKLFGYLCVRMDLLAWSMQLLLFSFSRLARVDSVVRSDFIIIFVVGIFNACLVLKGLQVVVKVVS